MMGAPNALYERFDGYPHPLHHPYTRFEKGSWIRVGLREYNSSMPLRDDDTIRDFKGGLAFWDIYIYISTSCSRGTWSNKMQNCARAAKVGWMKYMDERTTTRGLRMTDTRRIWRIDVCHQKGRVNLWKQISKYDTKAG